MTRNTLSFLAALLVGAVAAPVSAQAPEGSTTLAAAAADEDTSEEAAAAEDDIMEVLDLPLVAVDLSESSGVEYQEMVFALESAEEAGLPASEATEIFEGESDAVKSRGKKKGFGRWVARRIAAGERGKVIRRLAKMRAKGGEEAELSDEEKDKLKEAFKTRKKAEKERRQRVKAKRDVLKAEGKRLKLRGLEKHRERQAEMAAKRLERLKALKAKGATHPELDAKIAKAEKQAKRTERREERVEGKRKEAGADAREERKDLKDARKDAKEANKDAKDARKEARKELEANGRGPKGKGPKGKGPKGKGPKGKGPKGGDR